MSSQRAAPSFASSTSQLAAPLLAHSAGRSACRWQRYHGRACPASPTAKRSAAPYDAASTRPQPTTHVETVVMLDVARVYRLQRHTTQRRLHDVLHNDAIPRGSPCQRRSFTFGSHSPSIRTFATVWTESGLEFAFINSANQLPQLRFRRFPTAGSNVVHFCFHRRVTGSRPSGDSRQRCSPFFNNHNVFCSFAFTKDPSTSGHRPRCRYERCSDNVDRCLQLVV